MGLGVLDDKHLEHVPGTAPLAEVLAARQLESLHDSTTPPSKYPPCSFGLWDDADFAY